MTTDRVVFGIRVEIVEIPVVKIGVAEAVGAQLAGVLARQIERADARVNGRPDNAENTAPTCSGPPPTRRFGIS